ncbi:MAG: GspH/FimT family pseudopilin [Pseudomonadales bacterium]
MIQSTDKFSSNKAQHHQSGFTMMELLIVLLIAGILSSLAVPAMSWMISNNKLQTAAQNTMAALRLARSEAISRNQTVRLELQSNNEMHVCVVALAGDACPAQNNDNFLKAYSLTSGDIAISGDVNLDGGLAFGPRGRLAAGGTVSIGVCDGQGLGNGRFIQVNQVGRSLSRKISDVAGASCTP